MDRIDSQKLKISVKKAQNGNKDAFREIFDSLSNKFFAYVFSRTSNRDDALDIVQDVFVDLWKSLKSFKYSSDEALYGFIFTITKRKLSRYYKHKTNFASLDEISEKYIAQPEVNQEDYRFMQKHLSSLGSKYQDLLKLRYWSEMTFAEIASSLNITETAAKVRHHRALKKLKIKLGKNIYAI